MVELQVKGLDVILRRLKRFPEQVQRVTLIKAVKAGAQPILAAAQARVPRLSGLLASRLQVKFTRRAINRVEASIGIFPSTKGRRAKALQRFHRKHSVHFAGVELTRVGQPTAHDLGDPYYALWVEKGHLIARGRFSRRASRAVLAAGGQRVAPRPFLRPALEAAGQTAVNVFTAVMTDELNRIESL